VKDDIANDNFIDQINYLKSMLKEKDNKCQNLDKNLSNSQEKTQLYNSIKLMNDKFIIIEESCLSIEKKTKMLEEENKVLENENHLLRETQIRQLQSFPNLKEILNIYEKKLEKEVALRITIVEEKTSEIFSLNEKISNLENLLETKNTELDNINSRNTQDSKRTNERISKILENFEMIENEKKAKELINLENEKRIKEEIEKNVNFSNEIISLKRNIETLSNKGNEEIISLQSQITDLKDTNS